MKRVFLILHRLLFSGLFAWAGAEKLWHVDQFAQDLIRYRLLPPSLVVVLAWWVPCLELVVAIGLWVPRYRRGAVLLCTLLCCGFVVFIGSAWWRGLDISCGCFGPQGGRVGPWDVLRSSGLLFVASVALWQQLRDEREQQAAAQLEKSSG